MPHVVLEGRISIEDCQKHFLPSVVREGETAMQRRLVRPKRGRMIAGVAAGLADYLGLPVALVRLIWLFLLLPGGLPGRWGGNDQHR